MKKSIVKIIKWLVVILLIIILLIYGAFVLMAISDPSGSRDPTYKVSQDYEIVYNNGDFRLIKYITPDKGDGEWRENVEVADHVIAYQVLEDAVLLQTDKKYVIVPFDDTEKTTYYSVRADFVRAVAKEFGQAEADVISLEQIE